MGYVEYLRNAKKIKLSAHYTLFDICNSATAIFRKIENIPTAQIINNAGIVIKKVLEPLATHFKARPDINCFYRCPKLNKAVQGAETSQHLYGQAVDIVVPGHSVQEVFEYIKNHLEYDQVIQEGTWVHVSIKSSGNRKQALKLVKGKYLPA